MICAANHKRLPFDAPVSDISQQVKYREILVGQGATVMIDLADVLQRKDGPQVCLTGRVAELFLDGLPDDWFQDMKPLVFVARFSEAIPQPWPVVVALGDTNIALFLPEAPK